MCYFGTRIWTYSNEFAELTVVMLFKGEINSEPQFNKIFFFSLGEMEIPDPNDPLGHADGLERPIPTPKGKMNCSYFPSPCPNINIL